MHLTKGQFDKIKFCFAKDKEKPNLTNHQIVNAILYISIHRCKWNRLPVQYGNWKSVYNRMNKWTKNEVLETVFSILQYENIIRVKGHPVLLRHDIPYAKKAPIPLSSNLQQGSKNEFDPNNQPRLVWLPDLLEKKIFLRKQSKSQNNPKPI